MKLFNKIRSAIRLFLFHRQVGKRGRTKMVMGLDESKRIGIIFDAGTAADHRLVAGFVKTLQDYGKKVSCLGYVPQKKLPGYLLSQMNWSFFQAGDFKWDLSLKTVALNDFIDDPFDILLDLSSTDLFLAKYVAALSAAKYKVGKYKTDQLEIYDLLMQVPDTVSLQEYINNITHYLRIIKKPIPDA